MKKDENPFDEDKPILPKQNKTFEEMIESQLKMAPQSTSNNTTAPNNDDQNDAAIEKESERKRECASDVCEGVRVCV